VDFAQALGRGHIGCAGNGVFARRHWCFLSAGTGVFVVAALVFLRAGATVFSREKICEPRRKTEKR